MRLLIALFGTVLLFGQTPDDSAWQALDHGLHDTNPAKRIDALLAMSVVSPEARPVALIEGMLKDKDSGVREAACATLGEIKSQTSLPRLREALDDSAPEVIFAAARALYAMHDPMGAQILVAVLAGEQADASGVVSSSVREVKLKLHDPKALLMIGVNSGAGFLGPAGMGVPVAERMMKDSQASGKTVAALLLATDTTEESKAAVKSALQDKNWTVRAAAARAVALRNIRGFSADVSPLLDDKRDEVRFAAAAALIRLKQPI